MSKKRDRYLKKKKAKLKPKSPLPSSPFFGTFDEDGFQVSSHPLPHPLPKLSKMLIQLADPFLKKTKNRQDAHTTFTLASIAWNMSVDPSLKHTFPIPSDIQLDFDHFIDILIQRKNDLFPSDSRIITDFSFDETSDSLVVFSSLPRSKI